MRQTALIEITGYLAKDGELRYTQSGQAVLGMSVPYTRRRFDKDRNEYVDAAPTLWARFALWGDVAEAYAQRMTKGMPVRVKGIPELKLWEHEGRSGANLEITFAEVSIVAEVLRQSSSTAQQPQQQPVQSDADAWATPGAFGDDTPF
ncbi:single-stranded DNA-binding protein [Microbacterium paludicola]|uniref:single-stranded DNA-binding protein n=1 Tax=Microbacterium paludicola TaxID=300019 RepID=UPI0011A3284E|nr:single-stranded DNA-binding protein [Microbacterium paludicola]